MKQLFQILLFAFILLTGCVGTDYVDDPTVPERLVISAKIDSLEVGETVQFIAEYFNEKGESENRPVAWSSSDPAVVGIDQTGKATGLSAGPATITASAGGAIDSVVLNTAGFSNVVTLRTGVLQDVPGSHYHTSGNVRLELRDDGILHLVFEDNFNVSAGPSLYCLLANHTNGSYSVTPGGNTVNGTSAQITANRITDYSGARDYIVPAGIEIADYQYVVFYCTLGPVFGLAELK